MLLLKLLPLNCFLFSWLVPLGAPNRRSGGRHGRTGVHLLVGAAQGEEQPSPLSWGSQYNTILWVCHVYDYPWWRLADRYSLSMWVYEKNVMRMNMCLHMFWCPLMCMNDVSRGPIFYSDSVRENTENHTNNNNGRTSLRSSISILMDRGTSSSAPLKVISCQ